MPKLAKVSGTRAQALSFLLCLSLLLPFAAMRQLRAADFSVSSSGSVDLAPGESKTITFFWSGPVLDGIQANLSTSGLDGVGLSVSTPAGSSYTYVDAFVGQNKSSGELFTVSITAGDQAVSGSLSVSAEAYHDADSYSDGASAGVTVELPPTETTTTTAAETTTTTTAAETTTTTTAAETTTTAEETTTEETTTEETTTEETTTVAPSPTPSPTPVPNNKLTLTVNGLTKDIFALMNSNDAVSPPGYVKATEANLQGISNVTVFTKEGSLPLLYGALPGDTIPKFYLYDNATLSLYNFYSDILLPVEGRNWTISPIQTAPPAGFKYANLNINGQTTSVYESGSGGEKIHLVFAANDSTPAKSLYQYKLAGTGLAQLLPFDPNALPSPAPSTSLSATTLSSVAKTEDQGIDLMMVALVLLFVVLLSILGLLIYSQRTRLKNTAGGAADAEDTPLDPEEINTDERFKR